MVLDNGKDWRNWKNEWRKEKRGMIPYKPISNRLTDDGYEGLSDSEKMIITEQMRYMSDMEKMFCVNGSARGRANDERAVSEEMNDDGKRASVWRRLKDKIIKLFKI